MPAAASRSLSPLLLLVLVALLGRLVWALPPTYPGPRNDFPAYYLAGKAVASGQPERIYAAEVKGFMNLPAVSVLFVPLSWMSPPVAWKVWWWLSLAAMAATLALVLRRVREQGGSMALAAVISLAFAPAWLRCQQLGQPTPFLALLLVIALGQARRGRPRLAGLLLGVVGLIKIPPLLLLGVLALRRRWSVVWPAAAVVAAGVVSSWAFFGPDLLGQYADRVLFDNLGRAYAAFNNQGLAGTWMRLLTDKGLTDWKTIPQPAAVTAAVMASTGLVLGALAWRGRAWWWPRHRAEDELSFELAVGACAVLLVFPIVWIHYGLFLAVPLALVPGDLQRRGLTLPTGIRVLFLVAVALAGGGVVEENAYYRDRDGGWFRLVQCGRTLGVLLLWALALRVLPEVARREARAPAAQ